MPDVRASFAHVFVKGGAMNRVFLVALALLMSIGTSAATTQKWTLGWDNFSEPLNLTNSSVTWSVSSVSSTSTLTVTFKLVGATPTKLYQMSLNFFCATFPATFGQFPTEENSNGTCVTFTRQGVTATAAEVEVGVVLTDIHGNGTVTVVIGPIPSGTYRLEFFARNGAGCDVNSGGGDSAAICEADFQSPGPTLGDATTITVPRITSFSPTSGLVGTEVTINGVGLKHTTQVTFGGVKATTFTVESDTQVKATVPTGAKTGKIVITTPSGTATTATSFTVT
jgi:IPT/TIG domain